MYPKGHEMRLEYNKDESVENKDDKVMPRITWHDSPNYSHLGAVKQKRQVPVTPSSSKSFATIC